MPQAAIPIAAEAAVATTLTAAEIAAAQAAAAQLAAAELAAAQAVAATNSSVLSTIAATPVSSAAGATTAAGTGAGAGGAGGISSLVNTTGGPTTFEQVFSQGQEIAKNSTELGKLASTASELPAPLEAVTGPAILPSASVQGAPLPQVGPPAAPPPVASPPPAPPPVTPPALPPTGPDVLSPAEQARQARLLNNPYTPPPYVEPPFVPPSPDAAAHISRIENLSGIETLAKEVGAQTPNMQGMQGMQTMTSGYGAGAPPGSSVLPSMPVGSSPAPGIDKLIQPNLSSMGSNMPPAPPFANQTMVPSTPVVPPEAPIYEAPTLSFPPGGAPPQVPYDPTAPFASYPGSTPPAQPLYPRVVTPQVSPAPSAMNMVQPTPFEATPEYADAIKDIYDRIAPQTTVSGETVYPQTIGTGAPAPEAGGIKELFNQGLDYAKKNPLTTAMFANTAYNYLNPVKPYEKEKYKPTFKPGLYTGYQPVQPTPYTPQYAHGGLADLGGYSDGGRMLKGPGDGMSDDIPATIANKQPARLANEEFVIPADVVSHLGNGSSEAGAKVLYKMMDRVRRARTGSKKQGKQINPEKYLA